MEPVSTRIVHPEVWEDFKDELAKVWMSYTDHDGTPLKTRLHWAKEAPRVVTVGSETRETVAYLQDVYRENMDKFFDILSQLTEGVSVADLNKLFSNSHLDKIFKHQWSRFGVNQFQLGP